MPKKSRPRNRKPKPPAPRNPFAPLARKARATVVPSKKMYRRKAKHPKKASGGNGES
jgi:hypothetical protein